jgi:hypothetical protein
MYLPLPILSDITYNWTFFLMKIRLLQEVITSRLDRMK